MTGALSHTPSASTPVTAGAVIRTIRCGRSSEGMPRTVVGHTAGADVRRVGATRWPTTDSTSHPGPRSRSRARAVRPWRPMPWPRRPIGTVRWRRSSTPTASGTNRK
ncbi:hypothetical protein P376_2361 [Streptomyces sp. HCCB10043]|nr:hypothetical protein P376_2361 [Streptomyces sp. HCCB10043]